LSETTYLASLSGYTSDRFWKAEVYAYDQKNSWESGTGTIIQGGIATSEIGVYVNKNYYGVTFFDFNAIRTKNTTHIPNRIRIRLHAQSATTRTVYVHIGKGIANFLTGSTRPVDTDGSSVKTVSCTGSSWCEIDTTDSTWLNALVDSDTTCIYVNRYPTGYGDFFGTSWDHGSYWEGDGYLDDANQPQLIIDWEPRNTAPNPPSSITIADTGYGTGDNIAVRLYANISCGDASDAEDLETALLYQFEYSVNGGVWNIVQAWVYDKTAQLDYSGISDNAYVAFRVSAKDTGGLQSTYTYAPNYAYKLPTPHPPASVSTPSTVTTNSTTLNWGASPFYDASVGVVYAVHVYDFNSATWFTANNSVAGLSLLIDAYTVLSLDEANLQYYYSTGALVAVRTEYAASIQGETILVSDWVLSSNFTIDYRIAPQITSFSVNYTGTAKAYEGVSYNITINKGSSFGNGKDSGGNIMQYHYKVDILYGSGYSQTLTYMTTSNYVWASLPSPLVITIPSNIITTVDIAAKFRVTIYNTENLSSYPTDSSFTMKRYRNPVVNIKSFTRDTTEFSITFDITDTGLNDQDVNDITSAIATFNAVPISYTFASSLTNLTITFDSGDGITATSSGIVTLVVINNAEDSMADKSGSDTQSIPQHLPNLRISSGGVYIKGAAYIWDTNGVANEIATLEKLYPVGSLYFSTLSTNPATLLGIGTWTAFAAGKTVIGINASDTDFDTVEETGGAKTVTLAANNLPSISANTNIYSGETGGASGGGYVPYAGDRSGSAYVANYTNASPVAINKLPPYIVIYMWKRTA
jgi:hypothetical protein